MADLLGTNRASPSEEKTIPDEPAEADAFAGLPVGGSLDDAARAMRSSAAPAPAPGAPSASAVAPSSSAGVVPDVGGEDPLTFALRIAHQAAELAAASGQPNGGNGAHPGEPGIEATAPGLPAFASNGGAAAGASSDAGVVPEAPDAEDTVRRASLTASGAEPSTAPRESTLTEPTLPSESDLTAPDTSDAGPVIGEETPALSEEQRAALLAEGEPDTVVDEPPPRAAGPVPHAPSAEPTPSSPRGAPRALPEEPREEPTIRKSGPPPAIPPPVRLAPRTGTGPAGIGALGFRISANRPVVRPSFNGRPAAMAPATPAGGTPMTSGSTSIDRSDRVSVERVSFDRPSRSGAAVRPAAPVAPPPPAPVTADVSAFAGERRPARALPGWVLGVGIGFVVTLLAGGIVFLVAGGPKDPSPVATPTPEETQSAEESPAPAETAVAAAPSSTAAARTATPAPTAAPSATAAARTPTPQATPAPSPSRTAAVSYTPAPSPTATTLAIAAPSPTRPPATPKPPEKSAKERVEAIARSKPGFTGRFEVYTQAKDHYGDPDFTYEAFKLLASTSTLSPQDAETSKRLARQVGNEFVARYRGKDSRAETVRRVLATLETP